MDKRIIFKNGEKYPLGAFFSGINEKIIIPDLQRDYCWGSEGLVEDFVKSLMGLDREKPITMGLVYGYIDRDLIEEHLQLCDGQQRLTTLFLLLGVLARRTGDAYIREHLVSDFELNDDDKEPYLLYAIRESSLYFLTDLTYHYFLQSSPIGSINEIMLQPWFLDSYYQDPSIMSMIAALRTIEDKLLTLEAPAEFGRFLLDKVEFLFVDMESREKGEQTFVVINTTGEPLTKNENLKPVIIHNNPDVTDAAEQWEEMEQWFWNHRNRKASPEHTSDEGMTQFRRITRLLEAKSPEDYIRIRKDEKYIPFSNIPFVRIKKVFDAYARLYALAGYKDRVDKAPDYSGGYTEADMYSILPVIAFMLKFEHRDHSDQKLLRIFHLFRNMARYRYLDVNEKDRTAPAFQAVQAVNNLEDDSFTGLCQSRYIPADQRNTYTQLGKWADLESKDFNPAEGLIAQAESEPIFRGRIEELISWADGDIEKFQVLYSRFKELLPVSSGHQLDTLRRRLLSLSLKNYPSLNPGKSVSTLCNEPEHWFSLIKYNSSAIKGLLEDNRSLEDQIKDTDISDNRYRSLILNPKWMDRMERANLQPYSENLYLLLKKERPNSRYWYIFHHCSFSDNILLDINDGWKRIWKYPYNDGLYCGFSHYGITLDLEEYGGKFRVVLSQGKGGVRPDKETELGIIAAETGMVPIERFNFAYSIEAENIAEAEATFRAIAEKVAKMFQ